ncbi:MAG: LCP family protein [Lachnospiraceae bacterium]|nr:LCP family protein [Lachnospiraceae bacterium]
MAEKKDDKNKDKKESKLAKPIGYLLAIGFFVMGCVTVGVALNTELVPTKMIAIVGVALLALTVLFIALQNWKVTGVIAKVLSVLLSLVLLLACNYMKFTGDKIAEMSGVKTKIDNIQVYVLYEDKAQNINDAIDYKFGILRELDRANTEIFLEDINLELKKEVETVEYENAYMLITALYKGDVGAIILNSGYENFITEAKGFEDFKDKVRSIGYKEIESSSVEKDEAEDKKRYIYGENVLTLYVSGVDTRGSANVNSNSDVNILVVINFKTHQVLLIHTPRDYYVPISIGGGAKDKLTHTGSHGVNVSVDTMELLYGVNIDDYVRINFKGFTDIIDALGGIEVDSEYAFEQDGNVYSVGVNQLDGTAALNFARSRQFPDGDRTRGKNQMKVIEAMIGKASSSDFLKNYKKVLNSVSDTVVTSMDYNRIADIVKMQLEESITWDVQKYSVNGFDSQGVTYSAGDQLLYVMEPDGQTVSQAKEYLRQIYNDEIVTVPVEEGE